MTQEGDLTWFSEALLKQVQKKDLPYNLSGEGAIFSILHPALLKCQHVFTHTPDQLTPRFSSGIWKLKAYKDQQSAEKNHSSIKAFGGFPYQIAEFIQESPAKCLIHFGHLGTVYLSKDEELESKVSELHDFLLPLWLDYALSAELWGPVGKWTRFHERLHTLFEKYGLLIDKDSPGYYPLKQEAQWLGAQGFQGKLTHNQYNLIFPWDFPLSGLIELEKVLARGP